METILLQSLKIKTILKTIDVKLFNVTTTTDSNAKDLLRTRTVDAELVIPANFSDSVQSLINNTILSSTGQHLQQILQQTK